MEEVNITTANVSILIFTIVINGPHFNSLGGLGSELAIVGAVFS